MNTLPALACVALGLGSSILAQEQDVKKTVAPTAKLQSVGPIAFAEGHALIVSDPKAAAIFVFDIEDLAGAGLDKDTKIDKFDVKVAAMLGTDASGIQIVDVAIHPSTRQAYVSVMRGKNAVLLVVGAKGQIKEVSLSGRTFSKADLKNAPAAAAPRDAAGGGNRRSDRRAGRGQRGRRRGSRGSQRMESITDIDWVHGKIIVAGLSNEEFASKLRVLDYPFKKVSAGTSVEIYHGAHGKFETRSPVRTFVPLEIEGKSHIVAAYTCTPLVIFPIKDIEAGKKLKGKTIAELGNRNKPLDMIVYQTDGKDFLLMANSSRGVMKVSTAGMNENNIQEKAPRGGTVGQSFETIKSLTGVVQLDKLDAKHAIVLVKDDGGLTLKAVPLP
jgi:hypothetical protein